MIWLVEVNVEPAPDNEGTLKIDVAGVCMFESTIFGLAIDGGVGQSEDGPIVGIKALERLQDKGLFVVNDILVVNRGNC